MDWLTVDETLLPYEVAHLASVHLSKKLKPAETKVRAKNH